MVFYVLMLVFSMTLFNPSAFSKDHAALRKCQKPLLGAYIKRVAGIKNAAAQCTRFINSGLDAARKRGSRGLRDTLLEENRHLLSDALDKLSAITPPEELTLYHEKVLDSYVSREMAVDCLLRGSVDSAEKFNRNGARLNVEALEELKRVLAGRNAPKKAIDNVSESIRAARKGM